MANEITVNIRLKVANGNLTPGELIFQNLQFDQAAAEVDSFIQNIGTSEEDITAPAVTTLGWFLMRNLDATNYVTIGAKDTTMKAMHRIEAGEVHIGRLEPGITLRAQANTAACNVWFFFVGD